MQTFSDVIDKLGGSIKLAEKLAIPKGTVSAMKTRDAIPPEYWPQIIRLAEEEGVQGVTAGLLAGMTRPRQRRGSEAVA